MIYKTLLLSISFTIAAFAAATSHQCHVDNCDHERCHQYSLEKAFACLDACKGVKTLLAKQVKQECRKRVDRAMTETEQRVVFPGACGRATKNEAIHNLVPMEGVIVHGLMGRLQFKHWVPGRDEPETDINFQISKNVGEIGTGRPHGDVVLLSLTPRGYVVTAHVDWDKKQVKCLSTAYKLH